jgi:hypothetical protein
VLSGSKRVVSYETLVRPSAPEQYDPLFLDDPQIRTGKHRTVMNLESLLVRAVSFAHAPHG